MRDQRVGIIRRKHHAVRAPLDRRLENRHLQIDVPLRRALPVELDAELLGGVSGAAFHRRVERDAHHAGDELDFLAGGEHRSDPRIADEPPRQASGTLQKRLFIVILPVSTSDPC